jgi:hypothetical protein
MKRWFIIILSLMLSIIIFSNALKFVPKDYDFLIYIPDLNVLYNEIKKTNTGDIFANQVGLEQMIQGVIEQQLMVENYTLDDVDIFKELLIVGNQNELSLVVGPSSHPEKIKDIFEKFTGQTLPENVKIEDGYFIIGDNYRGGEIPQNLIDYLSKGYLAVSYVNTREDKYEVKGYGYLESKDNSLFFYNELVPQNDETKKLIEEVSMQKGKEILRDENIGGDTFAFINRKLPDFIMNLISSTATGNEYLELLNDFEGTAYFSADISSLIVDALAGETISSIPYYGVIYYNSPSWDKLEIDISKYETINGVKYGVVTSEEGTPLTYINLENNKIVLYGVSPDKYVPGNKDFITKNYNEEFLFGLFINLEPAIFNFIGIQTEAYLKVYGYIENGKIIQKAIFK